MKGVDQAPQAEQLQQNTIHGRIGIKFGIKRFCSAEEEKLDGDRHGFYGIGTGMFLVAAYTCEGGSSPTRITARQGRSRPPHIRFYFPLAGAPEGMRCFLPLRIISSSFYPAHYAARFGAIAPLRMPSRSICSSKRLPG
jgi:hypothetical protein